MRRANIALLLSLAISAGASQRALSDGMYVPSTAAPFNWSGVYLGATAGYANGFHTFDELAGAFLGYPGLSNDQTRGFAGGGTLGINWQAGTLVYWPRDGHRLAQQQVFLCRPQRGDQQFLSF